MSAKKANTILNFLMIFILDKHFVNLIAIKFKQFLCRSLNINVKLLTLFIMALLPYFDESKIEAGCDEAGRGCLAGPVVAAAGSARPCVPCALATGARR